MSDKLISQYEEGIPGSGDFLLYEQASSPGNYLKVLKANIGGGGGGATTLSTPTLSVAGIDADTIRATIGSVANETSIELQRSNDGSTGWTTIGGTLPADTTSYDDNGLPASTTRYYRVRAVGNGTTYLTSGWSSVVSASTTAGGGSYDTDAQAAITFIEGQGYTMSNTEKSALSTAFTGMKAGTLWGKRQALYVLLGTSYNHAKVNVFNPADTDAAYRLRQRTGTVATFANGITITSGGNDHGYDTANLTDTVAGQNSNTTFVAVSTNTAENRVAYGTLDATGDGHGILPRLTMDEAWIANNSVYTSGTVSTSSIGRWYNVRRGSTDLEFYKNGTSIGTFSLASGTPGGLPFVIGNGGNAALGAYTGKVTMAGNFQGLTDAEVTELDGIISALLTGLGK